MGRSEIKTIRQAELIASTIAVIHRNGFAALTVAQIAEEAQTSTGSIHYYFGGKDALLEAAMRSLFTTLKAATLTRLSHADGPRERLSAIVAANFDETLFSEETCRVWTQFWAYAPYTESLARLQRMSRCRVRSNIRAELKQIVPYADAENARRSIQSYMDGIWVQSSQVGDTLDAVNAQAEAEAFVTRLLGVGGLVRSWRCAL